MATTIHDSPPGPNDWQSKRFELTNGETMLLLTGSDIASGYQHLLMTEPIIVNNHQSIPQISLSLVLNRQPNTGEHNIRGLVERGLLTIEVQVGVPEQILSALILGNCSNEPRRLFIRHVDYALLWHNGPDEPPSILGRAQADSGIGRASLSTQLNRAQTLAVLDALEGQSTDFKVEARLNYRTASQTARVILSGEWAAIHDFLYDHKTAEGIISEGSLYNLLPEMASKHILRVSWEDGSTQELTAERLVQLFLRQAMVLLQREPALEDESVRYRLRPRPHPSFHLNYRETFTREQLASLELSAPLENMVAFVLPAEIWDDHVHLVTSDPASSEPIPRRVRAKRSRQVDKSWENIKLPVAALGSSVTSLKLAMQPVTNLSTTRPQLATAHLPASTHTHVMLDDLRIELYQPVRPLSLPIVDNIRAPYWRDRYNRQLGWYAPTFEIVRPESTDDPMSSPFLFSFQRQGVTNTGQPALQGDIRFTIRRFQSAETATALRKDGIHRTQQVPLNSLEVNLLVPFIDNSSGLLRHHRFPASISQQGEMITCNVKVLNEWVRLSYGALAVEGFQAEPVRIQIFFSFASYVVVRKGDLELVFGAKALHTPVIYSSLEASRLLKNETFLDATTLTYSKGNAEIKYKREAVGKGTVREDRLPSIGPLMIAQPETLKPRPVVSTFTPVKPQLKIAPNYAELLKQVEYAQRSQARRHTLDLIIPCNRLGRFYQEKGSSGPTSIGCQDALQLGQIRYQQYEEISELRDPAYRVYRSLPQPGYFLIVPVRFCISRRAPGENDAYRPLIFLNALIDPEVASNNRVELRVTLQPDLPVYTRRELFEKLKSYDPLPKLQYPTDLLDASAEFHFALASSISAMSEAGIIYADGPYISVYLQMDLASWQLLRTLLTHPGVSGSVVFTLSDGSHFNSNLLLKLDKVRGPWEGGPLELRAEAGQINLTNRIEGTIDVADLVRYTGTNIAQRVSVEASLGPNESRSMNAPADLTPVYSYPPNDPVVIEEVRSFVEEIYSNLIFINLLNFANHNLQRLDIEAHLRGMNDRFTAQLTQEMPVADIPIILPLTTYLEEHILEFRVTQIFTDSPAQITGWIQWDLDTTVPVSITSQLLDL